MTFDEILTQVLELLQRQKRVSYRALKVRFNLDDEYLEALKEEIIEAQQLAVSENDRILVWTGVATPGGLVNKCVNGLRRQPPGGGQRSV